MTSKQAYILKQHFKIYIAIKFGRRIMGKRD